MRIAIRVAPGAKRPGVGPGTGPGSPDLTVRVAARAVEGAATEAALAAVADALGVRRRHVRLVSGASSRSKVVEVEGDDDVLRTRLEALVNADM